MLLQANPLPTDGVVGSLKPEQSQSLKTLWKELLRQVDEAPLEGRAKDEQGASGTASVMPPADCSKSDQDVSDVKGILAEFGSKAFLRSFWRFMAADNPDSILLRFLRSRKWDTPAALAMLVGCIKWRITEKIDLLCEKGEEGMKDENPDFLKQCMSGKMYVRGSDRFGRPVLYVHVGNHSPAAQETKVMEDFIVFSMENLRTILPPPVEKVVALIDLTGFTLRSIDRHMRQFVVRCMQAYYPETLDVLLIYNPPWIFWGIWQIVSPLLDPVPRSKVRMISKPEDLQIFIPKEELISLLGGTNSGWDFPEIVQGENEVQSDKEGKENAQAVLDELAESYLRCTRLWIESEDDSEEERAREALRNKLREAHFVLDPFVRGRTAYHRFRNGQTVSE